jgi:hypothetical protein
VSELLSERDIEHARATEKATEALKIDPFRKFS